MVSGLTVVLCIAGLVVTGLDNFRGLTVGTAIVVALAVLGSVTALPALLALLGHRVEKLRIPWLGRRRTAASRSRVLDGAGRVGGAAARGVGAAAVVALLALALPATGMHLQDAGTTNSLPRSVKTVDGAVRMQDGVPRCRGPGEGRRLG